MRREERTGEDKKERQLEPHPGPSQVNELRDEMARLRSQYDKTAMEMKKRCDFPSGD